MNRNPVANLVLTFPSSVAWDTMGKVTFSETLGMLEAGYDHKKIVQSSKSTNDFFACVSAVNLCPFLGNV